MTIGIFRNVKRGRRSGVHFIFLYSYDYFFFSLFFLLLWVAEVHVTTFVCIQFILEVNVSQ